MQGSKDFSKMSLEELTPIVSMRPGKEYTKEELREARVAFMKALGGDAPISSEVTSLTTDEIATKETPVNIPPSETPEICELISNASPDVSPEETETNTSAESSEIAVSEVSVPAEETPEPLPSKEEESEDFILKTNSSLARVLYILYAYLFVPLLTVEALLLLIASVITAVSIPDIKYIFLYVFCSAAYTLIIAIAWHQFLYRSKFGLLLNRSLIGVCLFRGIAMLFSSSYLFGIIFIALSVLYLVFFIGYDSTFIIKSPKKRHVQ